jgi:hypothetical protein
VNIPKQLINLLGVVLVIGVVVAGVCLIALPMYGASQTTNAQARTVAETNSVYDIQVQQLSAEKQRMTEITASLDDLRREIADIPKLDDAYEIVLAAAAETGATITSIAAAEPEPWTPLVPAAEDPSATAPAPEQTAPAEPTTGAAGAGPSADVAAETPSGAETEASPQQQIPLTITVEIADAAQAAAFMDALGRGPRLISPSNGTLTDGTLVVSALAFIRTQE